MRSREKHGLTEKQREVLEDVRPRYGITWFGAWEAFPERSNRGTASRRTLEQLAKEGLLQKDGNRLIYRIAP